MSSLLLLKPMAKKRSEKPPHASKLRQGDPTPADLREAADELRKLAGSLIDLAAAIEEAGLRSVHIDGNMKFRNGKKLVSQYIKAVHKGLVDAE